MKNKIFVRHFSLKQIEFENLLKQFLTKHILFHIFYLFLHIK